MSMSLSVSLLIPIDSNTVFSRYIYLTSKTNKCFEKLVYCYLNVNKVFWLSFSFKLFLFDNFNFLASKQTCIV